jgi:hypothetical protein
VRRGSLDPASLAGRAATMVMMMMHLMAFKSTTSTGGISPKRHASIGVMMMMTLTAGRGDGIVSRTRRRGGGAIRHRRRTDIEVMVTMALTAGRGNGIMSRMRMMMQLRAFKTAAVAQNRPPDHWVVPMMMVMLIPSEARGREVASIGNGRGREVSSMVIHGLTLMGSLMLTSAGPTSLGTHHAYAVHTLSAS